MSADSPTPDPDGRSSIKVFLSYSRKDQEFAHRLVRDLDGVAVGDSIVEVFIDKFSERTSVEEQLSGIHAFEDWWARLQDLILQSDAVLFLISPDSVASPVCAEEIAHAAALNKKLAPVLWRDVAASEVPKELGRYDWVSFAGDTPHTESLQRLIDGLAVDVDWIRTHTLLLNRATEWLGHDRPPGELLRGQSLTRAKKWLQEQGGKEVLPTPLHCEFIEKSEIQDQENRQAATKSVLRGNIIQIIAGIATLWLLLQVYMFFTR